MAKTPLLTDTSKPKDDAVQMTQDSKVISENVLIEELETVREEIKPTPETDEQMKARLAMQSQMAERTAVTLANVEGPVDLPGIDLVGLHETQTIVEAPAEEPKPYEHLVARRRRMDDDAVLKGEGPLVDGARYNVVVRQESIDSFTPLYVTDAMTGERLPTTCAHLEKVGDQWYGQMHTRVPNGIEMHQGMDPVHLIIMPL